MFFRPGSRPWAHSWKPLSERTQNNSRSACLRISKCWPRGASSEASTVGQTTPEATADATAEATAETTDDPIDEQNFLVERSTSVASGYTQIATVGANVTSYVDRAVAKKPTVYYYRVRAANSGGKSPYSNVTSVKVK